MERPAGPSSRSTRSLEPGQSRRETIVAGEGEGALAAGPGEEQGVELEAAGSAEDGADGAVLAGGAGGELVGEGEAEQVDEVLGEGGEVGEGAFFDLAVFPVEFAEEVAGGLAGVGGGDVSKRHRGQLYD